MARLVDDERRRRALLADALLLSVAVFWGSSFVLVKASVARTSELVAATPNIIAGSLLYLLFRYFVAAGVFVAVRPRALLRTSRGTWVRGGLLALLYLAAMTVQTIGLQNTTPGVSGFITGLNVVIVPFLFWALARRSPGRLQIVGAVVAAIGLSVLSLRGDFTLGWGDSLTLLGAVLYAAHIVATGFFAPDCEPDQLALTQIVLSALVLAVVTPLVGTVRFDLGWEVWAMIVWTAVTCTVYAFFIQSWGQRATSSTHAAILLGFESVFAALTSVAVGMDSLSWRLVLGGALMVTGVLIVELLPGRNELRRLFAKREP